MEPLSDFKLAQKYIHLPQHGMIHIGFVQPDSHADVNLRTKELPAPIRGIEDVPNWEADYDIRPKRIFRDPFRAAEDILALSEIWDRSGRPNKWNLRPTLSDILAENAVADESIMLEQTVSLLNAEEHLSNIQRHELALVEDTDYCGINGGSERGRPLIEAFMRACLYAGIKIYSVTPLLRPASWCYRIGPCQIIEGCDHLWMSRFVLHRIGEDFGVGISFKPRANTEKSGHDHLRVSLSRGTDAQVVEETFSSSFNPYEALISVLSPKTSENSA